jgi:hypothetical protein
LSVAAFNSSVDDPLDKRRYRAPLDDLRRAPDGIGSCGGTRSGFFCLAAAIQQGAAFHISARRSRR